MSFDFGWGSDEDAEGSESARDAGVNELMVTRDWDDIYESIVGNASAYLGVQGAATWGAFWGGNVTLLPRGALLAGRLSEGVSEFADYYAEQVMWLPVEGALAGIGSFGNFAAVGSTARGTRYARFTISALRKQFRNVPQWALEGTGQFRRWLKGFEEPTRKPLANYIVTQMVELARKFGMVVRGPERGGPGSGAWRGVWHMHIGGHHIPCNSTLVP